MENEEYTFPKTKEELFKLKRLDLCCLCHRVPKENAYISDLKDGVFRIVLIKKYKSLYNIVFTAMKQKIYSIVKI